MKEYMIIIGSKIIENDWMQLTLIPLTFAKRKKVNLMELSSGNIDTILKEVQGSKQYETIMYIKNEAWNDMGLKIGSHMTVELNAGEI